jgi:LuxR family maltose regulon positive regulatory protein
VSAVGDAQFAMAKFRPTTLPSTLVTRSSLYDRLTAGLSDSLTVVVGSAGAGKSILLASWAQTKGEGLVSWLSCDETDADPDRFWAGFVRSIRTVVPAFGATAADLLRSGRIDMPDVVASIANDARRLPSGFTVVVEDFHEAEPAVARDMADLVALWPAGVAQLVLSSRRDPQVRLQRLRIAGDLCEFRDRDLNFSLRESGELLTHFGVDLQLPDLALLHHRTEGWPAALQMSALALRACHSPSEAARALDLRSLDIAEYFVSEVLDEQSSDLATFMLESSVLGELTTECCAAVTMRQDAGALLRDIEAAHLFLVALDDERTRFRFHRLVRDVLRAELRMRDRAREQVLQLRAAEWFESCGDARRAARHFVAAHRADHALTLLQAGTATDFLRTPTPPDPLDDGLIDASLLDGAPDRVLALAIDLLLSGDAVRGGEYLDRIMLAAPTGDRGTEVRLGVARAMHHMLTGRADDALAQALAVRELRGDAEAADEWDGALSLTLLRVHAWLEDYEAVDREVSAALAMPDLPEPVRCVMVPGLLAWAQLSAGRLAEAAETAAHAKLEARRLGVSDHVIAIDHLRAMAGLAWERFDLDRAEQLTEQVLSISRQRSPLLEYEATLDLAAIMLTRGRLNEALAAVDSARQILTAPGPALRVRAAELEASARLGLGDVHSSAALADQVAPAAGSLLLAKAALASGQHETASHCLRELSSSELTPRRAVIRELLLAATSIERDDPATEHVVTAAIQAARRGGFCNTVVTTAPQVTDYLVEHATPVRSDPYREALVSAAVEVRATAAQFSPSRHVTIDQLTNAERRVLDLLPTNTHREIAAILYVSPHTVKSHLRSIYRKLGAESRAEALQRAVELRLL